MFVTQLYTSLLYIFIVADSDKTIVNVILPVRWNIPVVNSQTLSLTL